MQNVVAYAKYLFLHEYGSIYYSYNNNFAQLLFLFVKYHIKYELFVYYLYDNDFVQL